MYQSVRNLWLKISLKKKLAVYSGLVILMLMLSAVFTLQLMTFALGHFNVILSDNARCQEFQKAMELEVQAFGRAVRRPNEEAVQEYKIACARSERCLRALPFAYGTIGEERYARTWNVRNAYENYSQSRDAFMELASGETDVTELYRIYEMQEYLEIYARRLLQVTLEAGNDSYQKRVPFFYSMPYLILIFSGLMVILSVALSRLIVNSFLKPLNLLAGSARKIAVNDFGGGDLEVENKDEMGDMVHAFNKMKHATRGYINSLMRNYEMSELLHREELERMEMEKRLEAARLDMLKNQINPHFLFNTLNMIACTARLEDAATTERMITSMSSLFRYNLKTSEQVVALSSELKVVEDYMYIQKMRFGGRIQYDCRCLVNAQAAQIPAFTLQPLVENAIVHGISRKEQGGRVILRVWQKDRLLTVSVADTVGRMTDRRRMELEDAMRADGRTAKVGIGLGNIYKRIHSMYREGDLQIYSRPGRCTVVQLRIPQDGAEPEAKEPPDGSRTAGAEITGMAGGQEPEAKEPPDSSRTAGAEITGMAGRQEDNYGTVTDCR